MSDSAVKVLGVSGSLRKASYNTMLLRNAADLLPADMTLDIYDIGNMPLYNQDLVTDHYPSAVAAWRQAVRAADALLFATPEYNYSITPALKNAIDWASRPDVGEDRQPSHPFNGKTGAIVGAGGRFGSTRAQLHLRQIFVALNVHFVNHPGVYVFLAPSPPFDDQGKLTDDTTIDLMRQQLVALQDLTLKMRA